MRLLRHFVPRNDVWTAATRCVVSLASGVRTVRKSGSCTSAVSPEVSVLLVMPSAGRSGASVCGKQESILPILRSLRKKLSLCPQAAGRELGWIGVIRKVDEVDPLHCPYCVGQMRIIPSSKITRLSIRSSNILS
jgi:hypothetical protein